MTERAALTRAQVAANVGLDVLARLQLWAAFVGEALGCSSAVLVGSALDGKTWRDLDVRFSFSEDTWRKVAHVYGGDAWFALCPALSAHASSIVGQTVDAQFTWRPDGYDLWLSDGAST